MANAKKKTVEKIVKLADLTSGELIVKSRELADQIQKKKLELPIGRLKNTREVFHLRKMLARVKTIITLKNTVKSTSTAK